MLAWGTYIDSIIALKTNRETVRKVLARMMLRQLAGAFDCYLCHLNKIRAQRERVQQTLASWKTPGLKKAFEVWGVYIEIMVEEQAAEATRMAHSTLMADQHFHAKKMMEDEAKRRILMCQRVVQRMLLQHLGLAWGSFVHCVVSAKQNRQTVRKVLQRMKHRQLAGVFDCYRGHVDDVKGMREQVQMTCWRTPGVRKALDRWLDYMNVTIWERAEEAKEVVRLAMQCKLEIGHASALELNILRANEEHRRIQMSKHVIVCMLRQRLFIAWASFTESLHNTKKNRETVRRILGG